MSLLPVAFLLLAAGPARAAAAPDDPPLVAAVKTGDLAGLRSALKGGASVGEKDRYGWTAVMWAVGHGGGAMTKALLDAGADPAPKGTGFNAMIEAAKGGQAEVVPLLAARGFSCAAKDSLGVPALTYAAAQVSTATARALLACRAPIDARDGDGITPLIRAVQLGQVSSVSFLLSRGAAPNAADANGYTALMWAASGGSADSARLLLAARADPALKAKDGSTAREIAVRRGRGAVAALLP